MITIAKLLELAPDLAAAAQSVVDEWEQDENGLDPELGSGGCCGLMADAMGAVLAAAGAESFRIGTDFDGGHEFLVALCEEGVAEVDVPARVYEIGSGYVWRKRQGVTITPEDVVIARVRGPMSGAAFASEYGDGWSEPSP